MSSIAALYKTNKKKGVVMDGPLWTTERAAKEWGIPKKSIYRLVKLGKLKPILGFKSWRFTGDELEDALERL